ncbi:MAG TPA: DAK2 domain-containing protein [Acidimicrobiales bacterium]|nr:DAK2 domain-containing protein [Acidimicrobiales bacterium]
MPAEPLAATALATVMTAFRDALRRHQHEINRLNVFPVPDGDTGTNMTLTLDSVLEEIGRLDEAGLADPAAVGAAISKGSLMGARGNSGVILCQILRGLASSAAQARALGADELRSALTCAAAAARAAVLRPVEGTILSVCDAAAAAAEKSEEDDVAVLLAEVRVAARDALWATPTQLSVLAEAGVVDAGGAGLLLLFDALLEVAAGVAAPAELDLPATVLALLAGAPHEQEAAPQGALAGLTYEVMYLLDSDDERMAPFKERWAAIGDSIVVVGGDGLWNCHIHTDDIGAAIEAGIEAGRPREIRVTDLQHQVEEEAWVRAVPSAGAVGSGRPLTSVVAVATGPGVQRIFSSLGVDRLVAGGQSMNPSTAEILAAAEAAPGAQVVVLPNNSNIFPVAEQVCLIASKPVFVVPTKGIQEGFAALLAYDPAASGEDNARLMLEATTQVMAGEVTRAVRAARTAVGPVNAGDWIGLSRQGIEAVGGRLADAALSLLEILVSPGCEIVTLIAGDEAPEEELDEIERVLKAKYPDLAVEHLEGGQPLYPLLISVE